MAESDVVILEDKDIMLLGCLFVAVLGFMYGSLLVMITGLGGAWIVYRRKYDY